MRSRQIYIAAPFFTPEQLKHVQWIEKAIEGVSGLSHYSPRLDGVLINMTPEERKQNAPKVFKQNCVKINNADAVLAILNEKDSGTTWELGYAYALRRYTLNTAAFRIYGWTDQPINMNVMLRQGMDALVHGTELMDLLRTYAAGKEYKKPAPTEAVT